AGVDEVLLEFVFDAQTSGGLLVSVAPERAEEFVDRAKAGGAEASCIVGSVESKQEKSVHVRM
ncbi:MAG: selenide, water dikinase SelD, partial [Planctomycetaceae bacterium]|nr:selenide, water dikinase SelD [Planctomycetaceae bacterium]